MSNDNETPSLQANDETEFSAIPDDFPRSERLGSLPGAQPKVLVTKYKDRFYQLGCSPPEVYERWEICDDLAKQLTQKSVESKAGKRAHMSEAQILDQYLSRLVAQKWTSEAEARWIIRRVAQLLSWPVPQSAAEPTAARPGGRG